jgi:hypothetical protein
MIVGESIQIGLQPKDTKVMNHCTEESLWDSENKIDKSGKSSLIKCSDALDKDLLLKRMKGEVDGEDNCHLKKECEVNILGLLKDKTHEDQCGDNAFIFIQLPCEIEKSKAEERQIFGLAVGCIVVFVFLYIIVFLDYIRTI